MSRVKIIDALIKTGGNREAAAALLIASGEIDEEPKKVFFDDEVTFGQVGHKANALLKEENFETFFLFDLDGTIFSKRSEIGEVTDEDYQIDKSKDGDVKKLREGQMFCMQETANFLRENLHSGKGEKSRWYYLTAGKYEKELVDEMMGSDTLTRPPDIPPLTKYQNVVPKDKMKSVKEVVDRLSQLKHYNRLVFFDDTEEVFENKIDDTDVPDGFQVLLFHVQTEDTRKAT